MSTDKLRIVMVGLVVIALTACGKSEEKKAEATPQSVAATVDQQKVEVDPALASRQLASQKSATEAARCGIVFATAVDAASRSGDSKAVALMGKATKTTQYVIDVAISDRGESPQIIKNTQEATAKAAEFWSQQQFETFMDECTNKFADMAPLMAQAGLLK